MTKEGAEIHQSVIFERIDLGGQTEPVKVIDATTPANERKVPDGQIDVVVAEIKSVRGKVLRRIPLNVSDFLPD